MKTKQKRIIPKTRRHLPQVRVEDGLSIRKHTIPHYDGKGEETNEDQYGKNQQGEGHQDGNRGGEWKDTQKSSQVEQERNGQNHEESVHPGTLQTLYPLSEQSLSTACDTQTDKTEIEAEVLQ